VSDLAPLHTLAEVAAAQHTTELRLLRFCRRHRVPVERITRADPWTFSRRAMAMLDAALRADKDPVAIAKDVAARRKIQQVKTARRIAARDKAALAIATEAQILSAARPWNEFGVGIYFLIRGGRVVYVGQSMNVLARVHTHRATKAFDAWHWIPCRRSELDAMERAYIDALVPELNRDGETRMLRLMREAANV
jgi:hypothetical protein